MSTGTEPLVIRATVDGETIVLSLYGTREDGALVIADGRDDTLITLHARRLRALLAACASLSAALEAGEES